ncbi:MAG: hypothetical protein KDK51_03385 [Deltaproteobacteria bacterium]|nr:hypothetical protein [Deltaproteobacteria bacterium]
MRVINVKDLILQNSKNVLERLKLTRLEDLSCTQDVNVPLYQKIQMLQTEERMDQSYYKYGPL